MISYRFLSVIRKTILVLNRYKALLVLLFIIFILRIPTLFDPHRYADEEIYLTLGQGVRKGLVLYRDIHDNKPPLLYLVAAAASDLFWFRFFLLVFHAFGVLCFWKLAELVFEKKRLAVLISTSLFGLFSTLPFLEGNIANGENFMIVPALLACCLFYRAVTDSYFAGRLIVFICIGLLFAVSFLFKIPIVFDFLSLLCFWCFFVLPPTNFRRLCQRIFSPQTIVMVLGFALPIALSIVYYSSFGAFEPYVRSALLQNVGYVSSWRSGGAGLLTNPLVWRGIIVLGISVILFVFSSKLSLAVRFVSLWTIFSMYGALLSSRPYPHYLLEPLAPVSLLVMLVFTEKFLLRRLLPALIFILILGAYIENKFWYYASVPYYRNFVAYALGRKDWGAYLDFFGARRNYLISSYIKQHTLPSERIFIWGTEPSIYVLTDRLPVGRYTVSYHIFDFRAFEETMIALQASPPAYIVVIDDLDRFVQLKSYLNNFYMLENVIDGASLYRRIPEVQAHAFQ